MSSEKITVRKMKKVTIEIMTLTRSFDGDPTVEVGRILRDVHLNEMYRSGATNRVLRDSNENIVGFIVIE